MISFCDRRDGKREAGPPMEGQLLNFIFWDFQYLKVLPPKNSLNRELRGSSTSGTIAK
jgi:hypothetical protein